MTSDVARAVATAFVTVACCGVVVRAQDKVNYALVEAKVVSVGDKGKDGGTPVTLEVLRVYKGPKELKGQTCGDVYDPHDRRGRAADKPFEVGEEGIFELNQVVKAGGEVVPWKAVGRNRKKENPKYADYVAVAEATERVEGTKPEERLAVLRQLIADKRPNVGGWAVREVGKLHTAEATAYLKKVAAEPDPKWPFGVQWAFDEVLCQQKDVDWQGTKPRDALLRSWVKSTQTEEVATWVLYRLDRAHQGRELADKLAVELLAAAAENKEWPAKSRQHTLDQLYRTARYSASDDARTAAWECVFGHMQKNDDLELRQHAAKALGFFPLPPARVKAIEEHLVSEKDEKVAASLRAAVKKAKEMK
jgi:hypothetical protein